LHIAPCLSISLQTSIPILFTFFALFPPGSISSRMLLSQRGLKGPVLVFLLNRRGRVSGSGFTKYMYEVLWSHNTDPGRVPTYKRRHGAVAQIDFLNGGMLHVVAGRSTSTGSCCFTPYIQADV
jgi:hypothetical protein